MSTDPAHSLGDSFDIELGTDATKVGDNLWAHEVSSLHEMQRHWAKLHEYAVEVFSTQGLDEVIADEVANPPGMDEVASLMWIKHYAQRAEHDVLIVDCAPTGETLQLLTFPDAAKWWLDKIYPWSRRAMRVARPVLQPMMSMPLPSDEVYASLKDLLLDLDGMRKILTNPEITTVRIVLNLEKMVVKEAKRAYTYLNLFGYVTNYSRNGSAFISATSSKSSSHSRGFRSSTCPFSTGRLWERGCWPAWPRRSMETPIPQLASRSRIRSASTRTGRTSYSR